MNVLMIPQIASKQMIFCSTQYIPMGIVYIATQVKANNFNVSSFVIEFFNFQEKLKHLFINLKKKILHDKIDVVCIGAMSPDYIRIKNIISFVKTVRPSIKIILGGG